MENIKITIKKEGHTEKFDLKKLSKSIYKASLNAHLEGNQAQKVVKETLNTLLLTLSSKKVISTQQLRKETIKSLEKNNFHEVACLYKHHENLC